MPKRNKRSKNHGTVNDKKTRIVKAKKKSQKFFKHLMREMFLLLEVERTRCHFSLAIFQDRWYLDVQRLLFIFHKLQRIYMEICVQHSAIDFIIVAMVIICFQRYFDRTVREAAWKIMRRSRRILYSTKDFLYFYHSVQHPIRSILKAKGESYTVGYC